MAGKNLEIAATATASESASVSQCLSLSRQWEVEYARYVDYPPLHTLLPTHPSLIPQTPFFRKRYRSGAWLQTHSFRVFLTLLPGTSLASADPILIVYHRHQLLEQHYVASLHYSWPQVTCISGFASRGTRTVFLSYKDCENSDQIRKFAFRFSTTHETERFISAVKETLEDTRPDISPLKFGSFVSSQQEFYPSHCPSYQSVDESWRSGLSLDSSSHYIPSTTDHVAPQTSNGQEIINNEAVPTTRDHVGPQTSNGEEIINNEAVPSTTDHVAAQASNSQELISCNQAEEIISTFPPSFTSFLMNCCPTAEQGHIGATKPTKSEVDFKDQIMKYMKDPSFQDILIKAEQLISEFGDDMQFP